MSGHSKWHKVKHQKAINDPKRGVLFTKLSRQIQAAARKGGPDPDMNPALRSAIESAKASRLPKENIRRAINKGAGIGKSGALESITLEGYGPGGVAFLIKASTDNRNRTVQEIRNIFKRSGGSLGEPGSAAYVFNDDPTNPSFRTPVHDPTDKKALDKLTQELEEQAEITQIYRNLS